MKFVNSIIVSSILVGTLSASNLTVDFMTNCAQEKSAGVIAFCACQWDYLTLKYSRAEMERIDKMSLDSREFKEFMGTIFENEDKCYALSKLYE